MTTGTQLLSNSAVAAVGGFVMEASFRLDASYTSRKIIDYAGTDSIGTHTSGGLDYFQVRLSNATIFDQPIVKGQWYDAKLEFLADPETLAPDPNFVGQFQLDGTLNVYLDDALIHSQAITRTGYGDSLNRPIGIGKHPTFSADYFQGLIYNPSVYLVPPSVYLVPEPSTGILAILAVISGMGVVTHRRRRGNAASE